MNKTKKNNINDLLIQNYDDKITTLINVLKNLDCIDAKKSKFISTLLELDKANKKISNLIKEIKEIK